MNRIGRGKVAIFFIISVLWVICGTAHADDVLLGSDYFRTKSALLMFDPPISQLVEFRGLPIVGEPGNTDTIVQRQQDTSGFPDTINIEVVNLSLENKNAVPLTFVGGKYYYIKITLDSGTPSIGTMDVISDEGTFTSTFTLFFKAEFTPLDGGPAIGPITGSKVFTNAGADWSHEPTAGSITVTGAPGDQDANLHTDPPGLPAGFNDFFLIGEASHDAGGGTIHTVEPADNSTLVELSLFEAIYQRGRVVVNWVTESETNCAGFDIERSLQPDDGYESINETIIWALGDEITGAEYSLEDKHAKREIYYYRLKEYELSGGINYYGPISIDLRPKGRRKPPTGTK